MNTGAGSAVEWRLCHVHDPMCSWCWAFRPVFARLSSALPPEIRLQRVLGGLAPDDDTPMPEAMRHALQATWRRIEEHVPGTRFDFSFWERNVPRRSTFRACRAVIAVREQDAALEGAMIEAIQRAYYLEARNPSERGVLIALASGLDCDAARFAAALDDDRLHAALDQERHLAAHLGARGFPSLFLIEVSADGRSRAHPVPLDYHDHVPMLESIVHRSGA